MVTDLRNPSGLPFRAGMNFTEIMSPACSAFSPVLPIPRAARAVAEPSVNTQLVDVPSALLTARVNDPCGFTNWTFSTDPATSDSFFMSYTPAREWWACSMPLAINTPYTTTHPRVRLVMLPLRKAEIGARLDPRPLDCGSAVNRGEETRGPVWWDFSMRNPAGGQHPRRSARAERTAG